MTPAERTRIVKQVCRDVGFSHVGIAHADAVADDRVDVLRRWLAAGRHGDMGYLARNFEKRIDPRALFPGAQSVVSVALGYYTPTPIRDGTAKISRYAWGDDYHDVVKDKLFDALRRLEALDPGLRGKCCVDTAPVMEKYWAVAAGIGWMGKHTNVITRNAGSWVFLGELILDRALEADTPMTDYCGSCTRCLDACPTDAFPEPYRLDATKCISYWTIEHKGDDYAAAADPSIGARFDGWVFGCDICQDVCPWNEKFARPTEDPAFQPRLDNVNQPPETLAALSIDAFRARFRRSPVKRTKLAGLLRNLREVFRR